MGTSASTTNHMTSCSKSYELENNNQQNQIITCNGGIATYNGGQGLCTTAKLNHDDSGTMEYIIQSHPGKAYCGGLTMATSDSTAIYSKSHGLDNTNQKNLLATNNCAINPTQDLHAEAHQSRFTTVRKSFPFIRTRQYRKKLCN